MSNDFRSGLEEALGGLKRALIDAYSMHGQPLAIMDADTYTFASVTTSDFEVWTKVTRPGADGEGGGVVTTKLSYFPSDDPEATQRWQASFESIRNTVDEMFRAWKYCPTPADFAAICDSVSVSAGDLTPTLEAGRAAVVRGP